MTSGLAISAVLHTGLLVAILLGLPSLFQKPPPPEETSIAVQLVNLADVTKTTVVNPKPVREAKPDAPPPVVPAEKPTPPKDVLSPPPPPPPPQVAQQQPSPPPPPPPKPEPPKPEPPPAPPPPPPAPVPSPAPTPPPPPPPKPETPQPPPPKPEPPKPKVDRFDELLKNLAKQAPDNKPPDQPQKPTKQPPVTQQASAAPNAPLGSQLTTSEKDALAAAVEACWGFDAGAKGAADMRAIVQAEVNPDGTVRNTQILDSEGRAGDPEWRAFAERARRALLIAQCNKLPIPPGKYDQMRVLTFTFTPKGVS